MVIDTVFNIGQQVWFMNNNKPTYGVVKAIDINIDRYDQMTMRYYVVSFGCGGNVESFVDMSQINLAKSKEELMNKIFK